MDARDAENYWRAITVIEAREGLLSLEASMAPHLKPEVQRKIQERLSKQAFPAKRYIDKAQLQAMLGQLKG